MSAERFLLDTCAVLWLFNGSDIAPEVRDRLTEASARKALHVSPISAWEIGMLAAKERIALSIPVQDWIDQVYKHPGISTAALSEQVLVASSFLPGAMHGDPADRILIATARAEGLTLVTRDSLILSYAQKGHLTALDC